MTDYVCSVQQTLSDIQEKIIGIIGSNLTRNTGVHHLFLLYHRVCNQINMTGATSGAGTAYTPSPSSLPVFNGVRVTRYLVLCVFVLDRCLSFVLFLLAIVLSVLLSFGHCVVCPSVFWPLCCLSFCLLAIVLSVLLSFGHCVVCSSSIY